MTRPRRRLVAVPHLRLRRHGDRWAFTYHTPASILPKVRTRATLLAELEWRKDLTPEPATPEERRWHVELARPAMRWFCRAFGVRTPRWLAVVADARLLDLTPEERRRLFGAAPLVVREFVPRARPATSYWSTPRPGV